ncbi:MAG TPA: hypothetical protein VJV23_13810 [Candidatus Polarisedimenticolia bacterium]|nr:hypothetical protein [Candidatus Polarisedimenticolia bacterium]
MHRLFFGLNLWSAVFLIGSALLGWAGSRHHTRAALFASVFACLVQCGVIALFLGAAKLTKEHVWRFNMPLTLIDRVNDVYHRIVPAAAIGACLSAGAALSGGLADVGRLPGWSHHLLAVAALAYLLAVIPVERRLHARMHAVILDVERLLPPPEQAAGAPAHPAYRPDRVVLDRTGRARALVFVGLTLPLPWLGYTYISGREVAFLFLPSVAGAVVCLALAVQQHRASGRRR